jgi:hypothetical protein
MQGGGTTRGRGLRVAGAALLLGLGACARGGRPDAGAVDSGAPAAAVSTVDAGSARVLDPTWFDHVRGLAGADAGAVAGTTRLSALSTPRERVAAYEAALELWASVELYRGYGFALLSANRPADAVRALEIALTHGGKSQELLPWLAQAQSAAGRTEEAFSTLEKAVRGGFNNFTLVERDARFAALRARADWASRWEALAPSKVEVTRAALVGTLSIPYPSFDDVNVLCANGVLVNGDPCGDGFRRGRWAFDGGVVSLEFAERCERVGEGDDHLEGECRVFERWKFKRCAPAKRSVRLERADLEAMMAGRSGDATDDDGSWRWQHSAPASEPRQCNPKFVPRTLADLKP